MIGRFVKALTRDDRRQAHRAELVALVRAVLQKHQREVHARTHVARVIEDGGNASAAQVAMRQSAEFTVVAIEDLVDALIEMAAQ